MARRSRKRNCVKASNDNQASTSDNSEAPKKNPTVISGPNIYANSTFLANLTMQHEAEFRRFYEPHLRRDASSLKKLNIIFMPPENWYIQVPYSICEQYNVHVYFNSQNNMGNDTRAYCLIYGKYRISCTNATGKKRSEIKIVQGVEVDETILQCFYVFSGTSGLRFLTDDQQKYLKLKIPETQQNQKLQDIPFDIIRPPPIMDPTKPRVNRVRLQEADSRRHMALFTSITDGSVVADIVSTDEECE